MQFYFIFHVFMLKEIQEWTKEDFVAFEERKNEVFSMSEEENDRMIEEQKQIVRQIGVQILSTYNVTPPEVIRFNDGVQILEQIQASTYIGDDVQGFLAKMIDQYFIGTSSDDITDQFYDIVQKFIPPIQQ